MSKPFQELCFTDDFMFCKVMQDPKICKGVLELILGIRIRKIVYPEPQKTLTGALDTHGIRLDVYIEDEDNRVFDVEMQTYQDDLPRRSRFYNGMIDQKLLKPGADYKELKDCFIIFLSTKKMFEGYDECLYVFENRCRDIPDLKLEDGVQKVFVTSDGDDSNLSEPVREFLQYLRDPRNVAAGNELLDSIETAVLANRRSAKMEEEYMYLEDYGRHLKEEAAMEMLFSLVEKGLLTSKQASEQVDIQETEFEKQMVAAGFKLPDTIV